METNFGSWGSTSQPQQQQPKNDFTDFGNFDFGQSNTKTQNQGNSGQQTKNNKQYDNLLDL